MAAKFDDASRHLRAGHVDAATHMPAEIINGEQRELFLAIALCEHSGGICRDLPQRHDPACFGRTAGEHVQYGYTTDADGEAAGIRPQHDCGKDAGAR